MLAYAGPNTLAGAVADLLRSVSSGSDCNVELEDTMLLLVVAYCLAAQHAHALQGHSAGDLTSPWDPDQEGMIKVQDFSHVFSFSSLPLQVLRVPLLHARLLYEGVQLHVWCMAPRFSDYDGDPNRKQMQVARLQFLKLCYYTTSAAVRCSFSPTWLCHVIMDAVILHTHAMSAHPRVCHTVCTVVPHGCATAVSLCRTL